MILLSAHKDLVFNEYKLEYNKGIHNGLLDNFIGILVTYLTLYSDSNVIALEQSGRIKIWHGTGEEWGMLVNPPQLTEKDLVIVVDVASGEQYNGLDFSLENISGVPKKDIKDIREALEWEGFKVRTKLYDGNIDDEDEAWEWKRLGIPVMSFIIPIQGESWHTDKCSIDNKVIQKAVHGLRRLINFSL